MNHVVWKNYLEGQILDGSLVPPIKKGVKTNYKSKFWSKIENFT